MNVERCMSSKDVEDTADKETNDFLGAWVNRPADYGIIGSKMK